MAEPFSNYKRILVAIDESQFSFELANIGAILCTKSKGELHLVYVCEVPFSLPLDAPVPEIQEKATRILNKIAETIDEGRIELKTEMVKSRSVGGGIISLAQRIGSDLIIIGENHYRGFGDVVLGRAVEFILKKAPCRVMVLRREKESTRHEES